MSLSFYNRGTRAENRRRPGIIMSLGLLLLSSAVGTGTLYGQTEMKRNRGESFYSMLTSNTEGRGNIWLSVTGIGHVWDNVPTGTDDKGSKIPGFWVSNARAFPEVKVQDGIAEFCMLTFETRPITYSAKIPGFVSGDVKLTWPNNKKLRFLGFGLDLKYQYNTTNGPPTLGGYVGFMPEGYVAKGSVFEGRFIFDADFISMVTTLPLRAIINLGIRRPLGEFRDNYQFLGDAGLVYTGYDYDFFATWSVEAFNNFLEPKIITQTVSGGTKRFAVWFSENPMYLTLGGNVRYLNGTKLSLAVPLLLSINQGSKMGGNDGALLDRRMVVGHPELAYEVDHDIHNPFDPWFVKWKIIASLSFPLRYKLTSAEMMRNFLLLKNIKQQNRLDIDNRLRNFEQPVSPEPAADTTMDAGKRLQEIEKRKEEMRKQQ
jgi:hypothetical protein